MNEVKNLNIYYETLRNLHLAKIARGEIYGPMVGKASIDKPWLKHYSDEAIMSDLPAQKIYDYFLSTVSNRDDIGMIYFNKKYTYREIIDSIENTAKSLINMGVKKGDIVTICMPTLPETTYLFYALNRIGAVANMIDPRTNEERIRSFINNTNSEYIFAIDIYSEKISRAIEGTSITKGVITSASNSLHGVKKVGYKAAVKVKEVTKKIEKTTKNSKFIKWNEFQKGSTNIDKVLDCEYESNIPVGIVYTGGTTGVPKGAVLSNEDLVSQAVNMHHALNIEGHGKNCKFLNIMPPFIAYGLTCGLSSVLCMGMRVDIIPKFDPNKFDELILKNKPEIILGVPSFFEKIISSPKMKNKDLSFLKVVLVGGDALNTETEEKINQFLNQHNSPIKITKGYGMTEMCAVATYTISDECNSIGSVGIPLVHNNVKVLDPITKEEVCYNEEGELYLDGPTQMIGYLNNEEETNKVKIDINDHTWIKSGDIGTVNENGELFIRDRIKRMVIRPDGHNVFPSQIENVIAKHPAVKQVAVVGIKHDDQKNGKIPTAFIVLNDISTDSETIISEIEEISSRLLPERDKALEYYIVDDLPYTSIGKVDFQKLEKEQTPIVNSKEESFTRKK